MNLEYIPDISYSIIKNISIEDPCHFFLNHMQNTVIFSNTTTY